MRTFNINTPWKNHKYCNSIITNLYRKINLIPETSKRIYNLEKSGFLETEYARAWFDEIFKSS